MSTRRGRAAELLIAAMIILGSREELNVSTSYADDEGVDLFVHRRNRPDTIAIQVKARFTSAKTIGRRTFVQDVRSQTFVPRDGYYVLFPLIRNHPPELQLFWLVPSAELVVRAPAGGTLMRHRFQASTSPTTRDMWRDLRYDGDTLPQELLALLP